MDDKPKLYVKKKNGRYVEYHEPTPVCDNAFYRKIGKRYEPVSMIDAADGWTEGVYAVVKHPMGRQIANASYLREIFSAYHCGDIEKVSVAKLGGMTKLAEHLMHHWNEIGGNSVYEQCASIVAILMNFDDGKQ